MRILATAVLAAGWLLAAMALAQVPEDQSRAYRQDDPHPPALQDSGQAAPPLASQRSVQQCVQLARNLRDWGALDLLASDAAGDLADLVQALRSAGPAEVPGSEDPPTPFGDMVRILATDLSAEQYDRVSHIAHRAHWRHGPHLPRVAAVERAATLAGGRAARLTALQEKALGVANELMFFDGRPPEGMAARPIWTPEKCDQVGALRAAFVRTVASVGPFDPENLKGAAGQPGLGEEEVMALKSLDLYLKKMTDFRRRECGSGE